MHLLLCICFIFLLFLNTNDASCFQSDATYALCSSDGTNNTRVSKVFNEIQLAKECQADFVQTILNKSCTHQTIAPVKKREPPTFVEQYVYGFIAVIIISGLSLVGLLALPILYKVSFKYVLNLFTAIAIGTLFGDAMFHLIPIVFEKHSHGLNDHHDHHDHDHHHGHDHDHSASLIPSYQWKVLLAVFILYLFYLLEVCLHWFAHYKHDHSSDHSHKHNEIHQYTRVSLDPDIEHSHLHHNHTHHNLHQHLRTPSIYSNAKSHMNNASAPCTPCVCSNELHVTTNPFIEDNLKTSGEEFSTTPKVCNSQCSESADYMNPILRQLTAIKSTGWMVLFGDAIHNFADGLAIGAAFSEGVTFGITTAIAVACHELPHELGDYAILLQSGFSHCKALLWNFLSATTAILGFLMSSWLSVNENTSQWIFAATIGMFLYIALVDLLPTLLADGEVGFKRFLVVNIGFLFGVTVMFLLAIFEDKIILREIK